MPTSTRMTHPDVPKEQAYIDHAYECLENMRKDTAKALASEAAANSAARRALQEVLESRLADLEESGPLCFGRIDEAAGEIYYVGRRHVRDVYLEPIIIDWRAPVAEAFYQAGLEDNWGLERRRTFLMEEHRLLDISEEVFVALGVRSSRVPSHLMNAGDFLLAELARQRTGRMRDIAATIQREQDRLIRAGSKGILVVQGAPGTGKTAVGLHRAAYLLYTLRRTLERTGVLVVGPNPAFIRYIERVLPNLGETTVVQRAITELSGTRIKGEEGRATLQLKGDERMATVLRSSLRRKLKGPQEPMRVRVRNQELWILPAPVEKLIEEIWGLGLTHREGRALFALRLEAFDRPGPGLGQARSVALSTVMSRGELDSLVSRFWPFVSAIELVRDTLGNRRALKEVSGGILDSRERALLARKSAGKISEEVWAPGDAPLIDEAQALIAGPPRTYGHVVVDEAQDLSPMQLRMIARRAPSGSLTVLGDVAQATGPWGHVSWDSVLAHLPKAGSARTATLGFAYRTPAPIMAIAARLLELIAPEMELPTAIRPGEPPNYVRARVGQLVGRLIAEIVKCGRQPGTIGVIVPEELVEHAVNAAMNSRLEFDTASSERGQRISILTPREVKGLEFDHVIVGEPVLMMVRGLEGLREAYVAVTRATNTLTIVHTGDVPEHLMG